MLSVHQYYNHFAPAPPSHAMPTRRHKQVIVERGRSRIVSQAAIARKESEERRKRVAFASQLVHQACSSSPRPTSPPASFSRASSIPNTTPAPLEKLGPVASSSSCRLPTLPSSPRRPVQSSDSAVEPSDSCRRQCVTGPNSSSVSVTEPSPFFGEDEESSISLDSLSLQDQMQQAYAACQITCLPTSGEKLCRCRNMHRARVLYLKTQGIDVTSDDDPRIDQVRDEDFEFVPGGELVLDEESLAAINEERERREREAQSRKYRARDRIQDIESGQVGTSKAFTHRLDEGSRSSSQTSRVLEFRVERERLSRSTATGLSVQCNETTQSSGLFSSRINLVPTYQGNIPEVKPCSVSLREVVRSLHGPLFPDSEPQRPRSPSRDRVLSSLLEPCLPHDTERLPAKSKGKMEAYPRVWAFSRFSEADASCIACSASSESTISRTNSWASATSGTTTSTCITTPPSSPKSGKVQFPSLVDEMSPRKRAIHSCRTYRRCSLSLVELSETPLRTECGKQEQSPDEMSLRPSHQVKDGKVTSVLVTRVRQSVHGLVDFASRMQQSYLRTIQFAVTLQPDLFLLPDPNSTRRALQSLQPAGYRASPSDVQYFAPYPIHGPTRDLNLPSDLNIPLVQTHPSPDAPVPPRVFAPLAFVPPSPLRPREVPITPEWRLRPVANPCMLRLKAHAKRLSEKGLPWEGRAYSGSLGCGRERLTGVAFEGLGGSRLAFEAK
ncbi:hypothetical protein ACEPAI_503 [Sanghuangporus weigelae]